MRRLDSITDSVDMNLSKLQGTEEGKEACAVADHGGSQRVGHDFKTEHKIISSRMTFTNIQVSKYNAFISITYKLQELYSKFSSN